MKSVSEIRDMIQDSNSYSPRNAALFEICEALLDHVDALNLRTAKAPEKVLPAQQIDRRKANRPNELVKRRSTDWPPVPPIHVVDYTKPHPFDFDEESGLKHTSYRVCKCGLSERNVLHQ
jgi:hypothetical protein